MTDKEKKIVNSNDDELSVDLSKEYDLQIINRGNCMLCGKLLTEGLFFCNECEKKAESRK